MISVLSVALQYLVTRPLTPIKRLRRDQRGQATAEYALVLLGVAAVALLIVSWATHTNKIGDLFDGIFETLLGHVKG
jgi:Flp pilus assembly pilin Flp